jgi:F0F1-type ATP synthase assembly protein I
MRQDDDRVPIPMYIGIAPPFVDYAGVPGLGRAITATLRGTPSPGDVYDRHPRGSHGSMETNTHGTPANPESRDETIARVSEELPDATQAVTSDPTTRRHGGRRAIALGTLAAGGLGVIVGIVVGAISGSALFGIAVGVAVALVAGVLTSLTSIEGEDGRVEDDVERAESETSHRR